MENITKGYASTYDDRNDYSCGGNHSVCCKYSCTCNRHPSANEEEIDIKKSSPHSPKLSCFFYTN